MQVIGAAPGASSDIDWQTVWKSSPEYQNVHSELTRLRGLAGHPSIVMDSPEPNFEEFAAPFTTQFMVVTMRVLQQYWRMPSYIFSKALLCIGCSLFLGFSFFQGNNTIQGLQNQVFGVFILLFVIFQMMVQIIPVFVVQRTLYEACERQSKTYMWQAFVISNIVVEMVWNSVSPFTLPTILSNMRADHNCPRSWQLSVSSYGTTLSDSIVTHPSLTLSLLVAFSLFYSSGPCSCLPALSRIS